MLLFLLLLRTKVDNDCGNDNKQHRDEENNRDCLIIATILYDFPFDIGRDTFFRTIVDTHMDQVKLIIENYVEVSEENSA